MEIIKEIEINDIENGSYSLKNSEDDIGLSKLNIFVGSNNSGKSRFIRGILRKEEYIGSKLIQKALKCFFEVNEKIEKTQFMGSVGKYFKYDSEKWSKFKILKDCVMLMDYLKNAKAYENYFVEAQSYVDEIEKKFFSELNKIYIPTLRGLRTFESGNNFYMDRTKNDYFEDIEQIETIEIFTGLELYGRLQDMLLGEYEERERVRKFEEFLSENFFEGKSISLIPKKKDNVIHIKIGEDQDFPIYHLGDGIQSIIILTFSLFENSGKQMLIGIEEPEIYLHPGMQRKLMEALLDKEGKYGFENFQYLITTHSNHFLDLTLDYPEDIKIYESKKTEDKKFEIIRRNDENMLELMDNIGVRNSSVFLANCTIWVEGITDRKYLKKYFEIYQKDKEQKIYEEDKHYSFVEYSGGNITHWDFLDEEGGMASNQISNNIFLIADTDGHKDKIDIKTDELTAKAKRLVTLESNLKDGFYALEVKEIENLLTPDIIMKLIREKEKDTDESIVFPEFTQQEYSDVGLGEYIIENLLSGVEKPKKYKADSGTVANKVNFCNIACKHTKDIDHLSEEAKNICEKLYNFIEKANK